MKDTGLIIKRQVKADLFTQMVMYTMEIGKMIKLMVSEFTHI
jgi:hypothetical protein